MCECEQLAPSHYMQVEWQELKVELVAHESGAITTTLPCHITVLVSEWLAVFHFPRVLKSRESPEIHLLIFQALKSPDFGLRCCKSHQVLECGPEKASH